MVDEPRLLLSASRFNVVRHTLKSPDGGTRVRDVVCHPGSVTILPLLDDGRVCLIRNHRIAVGQVLVELPAGTLEPGEDPARTAARELTEETGYRAGSIERLCSFWMSPGILHERMSLYLATGLSPGPAATEPGEEIEPLVVAWATALEMVRSGEIQDAKTLVGLLFFDRFRATSAS